MATDLRSPDRVEHRPFRFSLRMLLFAVLIVGLLCAGTLKFQQMASEDRVLFDLYYYPKVETRFGTIVRLEVYKRKLRLTDQEFARLPALRNLEHLSISENPITDVTLARLSSLPKLKRLVLARTDVTEGGVEELRRRLPNCEIDWTP